MEELDTTTAKIVSELSQRILPSLTKNLSTVISRHDKREDWNALFEEIFALKKTLENIKNAPERNFPFDEILNALKKTENNLKNFKSNVENMLQNSLDDKQEDWNSLFEEIFAIRQLIESSNKISNNENQERLLEEIFALRQILEGALRNEPEDISSQLTKMSNEFFNSLKQSENLNHELNLKTEKALKNNLEENRSNRNIIIQSLSNILEEILNLRHVTESIPDKLDDVFKNNILQKNEKINDENLNEITKLKNEIHDEFEKFTSFISNEKTEFSNLIENKTENKNNSQVQNEQNYKLLNNYLIELEGLLRSHNNSQTRELEAFSKELASINEQNNLEVIHKLREIFRQETAKNSDRILTHSDAGQTDIERQILKLKNNLKILTIISGGALIFSIISFITILMH